jgi:hypothetical protein
MPRFVILKHIADSTHFDLMFERGRVLKTFRAAVEPSAEEIALEESFDHPLEFLDYEGELSRAAGRVERWDAGDFRPVEWTDAKILIDCDGRRWSGTYTLERQDGNRWLAKRQPRKK